MKTVGTRKANVTEMYRKKYLILILISGLHSCFISPLFLTLLYRIL